MFKYPLAALCFLFTPLLPAAEVSPWIAQFNHNYRVVPDLPYRTVEGRTLTVDLYQRTHAHGAVGVVYYIHGGAWAHGTKSWELGYMLPWMELGWDVVSVEYRVAREARAPAAVEDCFCAYAWIGQHAAEYNFDLKRVIIAGASAGGNLALLVGLAPPSAGFGRACAGPLPSAVAIAVTAPVSDVVEILSGPHAATFTADWLGGIDQVDLARRVSPLSYVHPGLPPIFMVHGDADPAVPYDQALRFKAALDKAGVSNQLVTIPHGGHGGWRTEDYAHIYKAMAEFLRIHGLTAAATP